jgi:hypothetical protein
MVGINPEAQLMEGAGFFSLGIPKTLRTVSQPCVFF